MLPGCAATGQGRLMRKEDDTRPTDRTMILISTVITATTTATTGRSQNNPPPQKVSSRHGATKGARCFVDPTAVLRSHPCAQRRTRTKHDTTKCKRDSWKIGDLTNPYSQTKFSTPRIALEVDCTYSPSPVKPKAARCWTPTSPDSF